MKVLLFARARDLAGADTLEVALPTGATVRELRLALALAQPALAPILGRCAAAVDNEFVDDDTRLDGQAVVALLPPVSGG